MPTRPERTQRQRLLRLAAVGAAILAACKFSAGVQDRVDDALPDAGACAGSSTECVGSETLRTCAATGEAATDRGCPWGCRTTPFARCAEIVPAGGGVMPVDVAPSVDLGVIAFEPGTTIDGDNGRIGTTANANQYRSSGAPGVMNGIDYQVRGNIAVFRFNKLTIAGGLNLIGGRSIALVADGEIRVEGIVDARGGCAGSNAGPGGFAGGFKQGGNGSGSGGGSGALVSNAGGGGGGYGGTGGSGGGSLAAGGSPYGDATITLLYGGAGGGGGSGGTNSGSGGGGGGAVQLVSNARILISGGINAGGCGGKTGTGGNDGGGGAGAGGTILIEGKLVELSGTLAVNGGGGGGGDGDAGGGANATLDRVPAAGSATAVAAGGAGGAGSARDGSAGAGVGDGGGGGGAVGRIRINTQSGSATMTGVLSPSLTDSNTTSTQGTVTLR